MAQTYFFILGRTPDLAVRELIQFFPQAQRVAPDVVAVESEEPLDSAQWMRTLGGTLKIARGTGTVERLDAEALVEFLMPATGEIHFGVSVYGASVPSSLLSQMKHILHERGIASRYVIARHGSTVSTVVVDKKDITELIVVKTPLGFLVGQTEAVQAYEAWGKRDYDRPFADAKLGMLPPKVARMAVNLAGKPRGVLLDPFCGMGTVLAEAYMTGWTVIGSDIQADVVKKAQGNLAWTTKEETGGAVDRIMVSDASHVSEVIAKGSVSAIVTEPYMGATSIANAQNPDPSKVKNIIKGLEKLYIGCLREWAKILADDGVVVIALPEYAVSGRTYFVKKVIDMCENLGYTTLDGPIEYSRSHATVRRQFYVFRKVANK
jgi:tRNA G10  N-methylase Trm11